MFKVAIKNQENLNLHGDTQPTDTNTAMTQMLELPNILKQQFKKFSREGGRVNTFEING